jgi:hypothetical protein
LKTCCMTLFGIMNIYHHISRKPTNVPLATLTIQ